MGTFADLWRKGSIPEDRMEEFENRLEKLFQAGGMMELDTVSVFGKKVVVMRKATMHDYGMDFTYNYFEDCRWENAGYNKERKRVWSNKIGWKQFHMVIVAAYILEGMYIDGLALARVDGHSVCGEAAYVGWINQLFNEKYTLKNRTPWKLYEALCEEYGETGDFSSRIDWDGFVSDIEGIAESIEIRTAEKGTDYILELCAEARDRTGIKDDEGKIYPYQYLKPLRDIIEEYKNEDPIHEDERRELLIEMLITFYEKEMESAIMDDERYQEKIQEKIRIMAFIIDLPVYLVKAISEVYDMDFWELWESFKNVAKMKRILKKEEVAPAAPVKTEELMQASADDMLYFWEGGDNAEFSDGMRKWFRQLEKNFERHMFEDIEVESPFRWIIDLMERAYEEQHNVMTFADFFEESVDNLKDRRYRALWKIYEEMLDSSEEENPRCNFRRYMALVANRKLRHMIFGF